MKPSDVVNPAQFCRALLAALEASEGRRRRRKRDQTPDTIGLVAKRELLVRVVEAKPSSEAFEEWLLCYVRDREDSEAAGTALAMARAVLEEWRLTQVMGDFAVWLERGAPSADADRPA